MPTILHIHISLQPTELLKRNERVVLLRRRDRFIMAVNNDADSYIKRFFTASISLQLVITATSYPEAFFYLNRA